jgi:hypothetical protein
LALFQKGQQDDLTIRKFQGVVMSRRINAPADRGRDTRARQAYRMENQAGSRFRRGRFIERDI